jgi:HlyD family secretion protein
VKKKIIFAVAIIIVLVFAINRIFFKKEELSYIPEKVQKGTIVENVSESGTVEMGENVNLSFKSSGKIESIYIKKGDRVVAGQNLAKLETSQLQLQLEQARASVNAQKAKLSELQRGANTGLDSLYVSTPTVLNQAYNLTDSAIRQQIASFFLYRAESSVPDFELTYKTCDSQAAAESESQRKIIENNLNLWSAQLQNLDNSSSSLDDALGKAENYLKSAQSLLNRLNDTLSTDCNLTSYEASKINTYKPIVNTAITSLNTALTSVLTQIKNINDQKQTVENYTTNQEDINYQEALVKQAESGVVLLEDQIRDALLKSPVDGQIAEVDKEKGESAQLMTPFIVLIPKSPFQVTADIYEEDIVKVEVGNPVEIELTAFPDKLFEGKVVSIDPTSNLINGVVYFGIKVDFQNPPINTRPGMSADITIKTAEKDGVLMISNSAVEKKDGKSFVQVVGGDGKLQEKEIEIGIKGENGKIEVLSGLSEGETLALPK